MRHYPLSPFALWSSVIVTNRSLLKQLVIRDVSAKYKGSLLGLFWALLNPLFMLAVYSFVFVGIFNVRWGQETGAKGEFALVLFAGLMLHNFLAECLMRAPNLIVSQANFVKKVVFPLEILAPSVVLAALFHLIISTLILISAYLVIHHVLPWTVIFFPIVLLPFFLLVLGITWILASLGVYLRDINQMMNMVVTVLLFMSTVLFPATALPDPFKQLIYLNPLSFIVEQVRWVLLWEHPPYWRGLAIYTAASIVLCYLGYVWFQRTRRGFADVL